MKFLPLLLIFTCFACTTTQTTAVKKAPTPSQDATYEVVAASEVKWEALNPARGDKSPKAGTLWGDRKANVATGFLVQFVDGFSSPPHIHNVTYKGVVISGLVHNDDPNAANMWMPQGSFWTQPKGESHITSAKGKTNIAYIEIDAGPYLVKPVDQAFDSGERPVNIDASNIVWTNTTHLVWGSVAQSMTPKMAALWQSKTARGHMIKLPKGFDGTIHSHGGTFKAIVISGTVGHAKAKQPLAAGSYFGSKGNAAHDIKCASQQCVLYTNAQDAISFSVRSK